MNKKGTKSGTPLFIAEKNPRRKRTDGKKSSAGPFRWAGRNCKCFFGMSAIHIPFGHPDFIQNKSIAFGNFLQLIEPA